MADNVDVSAPLAGSTVGTADIGRNRGTTMGSKRGQPEEVREQNYCHIMMQ